MAAASLMPHIESGDLKALMVFAPKRMDSLPDVATAAELGKTAGKDAAAEKLTYPAIHGLERSRVLARRAVEAAHDTLTLLKTTGRLADIADWVGSRSH